MKLFKFEMSKLWRQKKFILLLIVVLIGVSGIYLQHHFQQPKMGERAVENIQEYIGETDILYATLNALSRENMLDEQQEQQYESTNAMANAFFQWKSAIYNENWHEIPQYENDFLTNLQDFEKAGGHFKLLQGMEQEIAIAKNEWLLTHNLSYEDEAYPVSPALILKDSAGFLLGVVGVLILLLFFGNTITVEKEHHTWSTLKTQPIKKWKLIVAKYATALVAILALLVMVVVIGLVIPLLFSGHSINLDYPQVLKTADSFTVISTLSYLLRGFVLFICAGMIAFGLIFIISTCLKNSFSALIITGFIILIGFFTTDLFTSLQTAFNPFYYFHFTHVLAELTSVA